MTSTNVGASCPAGSRTSERGGAPRTLARPPAPLASGEPVPAELDPIEKKPLYHVLPGTTAYSIATRGCSFHCRFCQNWAIAQAPREGVRTRSFRLPPHEVVARGGAPRGRS